jgi:uncharacterized protein
MKKIYRFLLSATIRKLFVLYFTISLFSSFLIVVLKYIFLKNDFLNQSIEPIDLSLSHFILAVIIAPLLETAIFQKMAISLVLTFAKNNLIAVAVSAVLFGLCHYDSITKIFQTMLMGLCLGLFYTVLKQKGLNAFFLTALLHSSWNLFVFIMRFIIK